MATSRWSADQYNAAAQFILDNINNPAAIAQAAETYGVTLPELTEAANIALRDILKRDETYTTGQVAQYFTAQPTAPDYGESADYVQSLAAQQALIEAEAATRANANTGANLDALANAAINQWQTQTKTPSPWTFQQVRDYIAANPNTYQAGLNQSIAEAIAARPIVPIITEPPTKTIPPPTATGTNLVPDWTAYANANPDVTAEWNRLKTTEAGKQFPTLESFAQYHYNTFGKGENRPLPQIDAATFANRMQAASILGLSGAQLANKAEADARLAAAKEAIEKQPFSVSGLRNALDVSLKGPPNWDSYSLPQKIAWLNQNKVSLPQLAAVGITDQALIDSYIRAGFQPAGTATLAAAPTTQTPFVSTPPAAPKLAPTAGLLNAGPLINDLYAQYEAGTGTKANIAPQDVFNYIQANPNTYGQVVANAIDTAAPVTKNMGGPIAFAAGDKVSAPKEMSKYGYKDFGIPSYLDENLRFNTEALAALEDYRKGLPRNVVFNPVLEAAERAEKQRGIDALAERLMMVRQGRTGAEYFPASMFERTTPASSGIRALYQYAEGGGVGRGLGSIAMKGYAEEMAQKGRFGDTMLAHISPEEAQMLQAAGGAGTINPETGLPEYFSWKKLFKKAGPLLGIAASLFGGPLAGALVGGISGGFSGPGGKFNWKRGLLTGIASYGLGQLGKGLTGAADAGAAATSTVPGEVAKGVTTDIAGSVAKAIPAQAAQVAPTVGDAAKSIMFAGQAGTQAAAQTAIPAAENIVSRGISAIADKGTTLFEGAKNLVTNAPGAAEGFKAAASMTPYQAAMTTALPTMAISGMDEATKQQMEAAKIQAEKEEEERRYNMLAQQTLGGVGYGMARGGSVLAHGGATGPANAPRTINGAGDGMSDSVPATIEGVQEARLADGEFVIPADVVADLGNGSSNAGSKKLYAMMDRVRKARHGTTKQPPEINMGRLMPA
jgi:hypothetical protein